MLTTRLLPEGEWAKLDQIEPFKSAGRPDPLHWMIPVVEKDGQIVASCALFDTVHWDGFHVTESERGNPAVFRALLEQAITTLRESGVPGVHVTIPPNSPELELMVERFGFVPSTGKLYIWSVHPPEKD